MDTYISVNQLNTYIKNIFEAEIMLQNICVFGEIGSYSLSNGIAYFNLKDDSGMLQCVLFGANNFQQPKVGDMVLVKGSMNYYAKGGKLSFNAYSIMPYGKGLLYEKFLKLKEELGNRGYFAEEHKKPIPARVRRIGVVSSPTGAVIRDIIDVTHRRNDSIDIVLYPVKVQGLGADKEISNGIDFFSSYNDVDVVIVARGGGSMEDLEPFNSEIVATSAYNCKKPLVSAVGHETDFTIIDFVADLRAPTPSAAAELVAWEKYAELSNIMSKISYVENIIKQKIINFEKDIDSLYESMQNYIEFGFEKLNNKLSNDVIRLSKIDIILDKYNNMIDKFMIQFDALNPSKLSNLGYSKILQKGKAITKIAQIDKNDDIIISMIDGKINCKPIGD